MEPRISIITLGVSDLGRSTRFYRDGLRFPEHEAGGDEITFLVLAGLLHCCGPTVSGRWCRWTSPHSVCLAHPQLRNVVYGEMPSYNDVCAAVHSAAGVI